MNPKKQFKRYIPKLIKDELDQLDYPRKDNLYTIIDLINRKEIYFKSDLQKSYGYTEISLVQFKELIPSSNNLNEDINFLVEQNIIRRNNFYISGFQCKGYKISTEYLGKTVSVTIQNKNINKRIRKQIESYRRIKVKSLEFAKTEYFKTFKIDIIGANKTILDKAVTEIKDLCTKIKLKLSENEILDIIECKNGYLRNRTLIILQKEGKELHNILHRFMIYSTRINAINDGFLFFKRNKTNGRLDSNLTSLPSFLRPFVISNEKLINVDIKNSQPYFLYTLIKNKQEIDKVELAKYADLVIGGKLYEFLAEKYKSSMGYERTRGQIKQMLFKIYYSRNTSYESIKKFFATEFPTIMAYIYKTNSIKHNTLSIQLQTIESYSILDVIMPLLEQKGIRPYTIHDSFVCKESEAKTIEEIFTNKLIELYSIAPALHVEFIDAIEEDDDEIIECWDDAFLMELNAAVDKAFPD